MREAALLEYLFDRQPHRALPRLSRWISEDEAFHSFVDVHKEKIRRKLTQAGTTEDGEDVVAELEIAACILADPRFTVAYEPYGNAACRSPDFLVTYEQRLEFNLEVKRIREAQATESLHTFMHAVIEAARAVPSSLGISLDIRDFDNPVDLSRRLLEAMPAVIQQCVQAIRAAEASLAPDEDITIPVAGFEGQFQFTLSKVRGRPPDSPTANFGGVWTIPYTQRESFKFSDHVLGCLGQLRLGMANALVLRIHSCTHEPEELPYAILELNTAAERGDDAFFQRKKFADAADYLARLRALSIVVVRGQWVSRQAGVPRNFVWLNPSAVVPLPVTVAGCLASMNISE